MRDSLPAALFPQMRFLFPISGSLSGLNTTLDSNAAVSRMRGTQECAELKDARNSRMRGTHRVQWDIHLRLRNRAEAEAGDGSRVRVRTHLQRT